MSVTSPLLKSDPPLVCAVASGAHAFNKQWAREILSATAIMPKVKALHEGFLDLNSVSQIFWDFCLFLPIFPSLLAIFP